MADAVEVVGVYEVWDAPDAHLVEVRSATPPDELDVGGFTQEEPGFLAFDRPLLTPAGQVELPKPTPAPIRLAGLAYEPVD